MADSRKNKKQVMFQKEKVIRFGQWCKEKFFTNLSVLSKYFSVKIFVIIGIVFIFFAGAWFGFYHWLDAAAGDGKQTLEFSLPQGWQSRRIAKFLTEKKIIDSDFKFRTMLKLLGKGREIKSGYYLLNDAMKQTEIINVITSGHSKEIKITIPEGFTNRQIGDLLTQKKIAKSRAEFLQIANDKKILEKYRIPAKSSEGYLFPDTYFIPLHYKSKDVVQMMIRHFIDVTRSMQGFPANPKKIHELVILASIVEREAQRKEERALIAGVFANRLKKDIPLESCATVQYLFEKPKKRLYYSDLEIQSPYNTYLHNGLPPTPIANPGRAALEASLHPKNTDFLFFVVRGDGFHQFSKNFNDHLKAKKDYILRN